MTLIEAVNSLNSSASGGSSGPSSGTGPVSVSDL